MGMHLCFQIVTSKANEYGTWDFDNCDRFITEEYGIDTLRWSCDDEFASMEIECDWKTSGHEYDGNQCWRPVDFQEAHQYVNDKIEDNKVRFHAMLNVLETNPDIYIYNSY